MRGYKYTLEEFEEEFWLFVPESIISNNEIEDNRDFCETIVEKMYKMYINGNVSHIFMFQLVGGVLKSFKDYNFKETEVIQNV